MIKIQLLKIGMSKNPPEGENNENNQKLEIKDISSNSESINKFLKDKKNILAIKQNENKIKIKNKNKKYLIFISKIILFKL